jgi:hypothetical protein
MINNSITNKKNFTENEDKEKNKIIELAYDAATKIYNKNAIEFQNKNISKDDFLQDAAMYILYLYEIDYMYLDKPELAPGMVRKMLNTFFLNEIRDDKAKKLIRTVSMDEELEDSENNITGSDLIPSKELSADKKEFIEYGKMLLEGLIEEFSIVPYQTTKHSYTGKVPGTNEQLSFSEYNIAKLLLDGYSSDTILKIYDVYTPNIGSSVKASVVYRKIKNILDKLEKEINTLDNEDRSAVVAFIEKEYNAAVTLTKKGELVLPDDFDPSKVTVHPSGLTYKQIADRKQKTKMANLRAKQKKDLKNN